MLTSVCSSLCGCICENVCVAHIVHLHSCLHAVLTCRPPARFPCHRVVVFLDRSSNAPRWLKSFGLLKVSHFHRSSNMAAEHGRVGKRRAAWRIITSVELASRRQTTYATEYEEFMAESSASRADEVKAAVASDVKALSRARVPTLSPTSMLSRKSLLLWRRTRQEDVCCRVVCRPTGSGHEYGGGVRVRSP